MFVIFSLLNIIIIPAHANNILINSNYIVENQDIPQYLLPGDIIFFECGNYSYYLPGWDHCGIYIGDGQFIHASEYLGYIAKHNLTFFMKMDLEIGFGTVKSANESQRYNAIEFAESQLGKPYGFSYPKSSCANREEWCCTDLIWAAYINQGIDIDINGWRFPKFVDTLDICWDDDVVMYTKHNLNNYYPGFYTFWLINYVINNYKIIFFGENSVS